MSQHRLLKYIIGLLFVMNIALLCFLFFTRPPGPHPGKSGNPIARATEQLDLNKEQVAIFEKAARKHHQTIQELEAQQSKLLESHFLTLTNDQISSVSSVLQEVNKLENQKITTTYDHFKEVKDMLTAEQQELFRGFMEETLDRILRKEQKRPRPPRGF